MSTVEGDQSPPVAVVGFSLRFPGGATSPDSLWDLLSQGKSAWSEFPKDRFSINDHYHPNSNRQGSISFRGGHFIQEDVFRWDAAFFATSANEAVAIDPQQRMLLEITYEALESAGITKESIDGSDTSVFCGSFVKDYEQMCLKDPDDAPQYAATGNGIALMSNRISHFFNLKGPSMTVDTGCSASLVCFHQAVQSLLSGESDTAIVAGAGMILTPNTMMPMMGLNFLSPDGKCFTFDSRANGYGRGEGIAVLVLKRSQDAFRDKNPIRCMVRSTAINQDGRTPGITLPSMEAQASNIRRVYRRAGLDFDKTAFVECHGTGTKAGDWRELRAVSETIARDRTPDNPVIVGSIKTNIGHLEGAAGVAGLIKMIMCLEKGKIPKHLNFQAPGNPDIDFEEWKVKVPTEIMDWPRDGLRRGSVNCFGFGGTNAHTILEDAGHFLKERAIDYPIHNTTMPSDAPVEWSEERKQGAMIFIYSAHDQAATKRMLATHAEYLRGLDETTSLADYAYTLACRRSILPSKTFFIARTKDDLIQKLEDSEFHVIKTTAKSVPSGVIFAFCGQGAQWFAMGRELMADYPSFARVIQDASDYLSTTLGATFNLYEELHKGENDSSIDQPQISQPATTILQIALVDFLRHVGVTPAAVIGHSSGEIAAAYAKGAIGRDNAIKIAFYRGQAAGKLKSTHPDVRGAMTAVALTKEKTEMYIHDNGYKDKVCVACINGPESVTISGDEDGIEHVETILKAAGVIFTRLRNSVAYHSHHMDLVVESYADLIKDVGTEMESAGTGIRMFSSVYGREAENDELGASYWSKNLVSPVNFVDAAERMLEYGPRKTEDQVLDEERPKLVFELSPHAVLARPFDSILQHFTERNPEKSSMRYLPVLVRCRDASMTFLGAIGEAFQHTGGFPKGLNVKSLIQTSDPTTTPQFHLNLPNYPFDRSKCYIWESQDLKNSPSSQLVDQRQDLIGRPRPTGCEPHAFRWRGFLRPEETPWLNDHKVQGVTVYPAAGMVAMVLQAGRQISENPAAVTMLHAANPMGSVVGYKVVNMEFVKAMVVPLSERGLEMTMMAVKRINNDTVFDIVLSSSPPHVVNARGELHIVVVEKSKMKALDKFHRESEIRQGITKLDCPIDLDIDHFYSSLDDVGLNYGPLFRGVKSMATDKGKSKGLWSVAIPDTKSAMPDSFEFDHLIHPATLDSMFQSVAALNETPLPMVPTRIGEIYVGLNVLKGPGNIFQGSCEARRHGTRKASADIVARDSAHATNPIIIGNLEFTSLEPEKIPQNKSLCSTIVWRDDVNHMAVNTDLGIKTLIQSLAFKKPGLSVLLCCVTSNLLAIFMDDASCTTEDAVTLGINHITFLDSSVEHYHQFHRNQCTITCIPASAEAPLDALEGPERFDIIISAPHIFTRETVGKFSVEGGVFGKTEPVSATLDSGRSSIEGCVFELADTNCCSGSTKSSSAGTAKIEWLDDHDPQLLTLWTPPRSPRHPTVTILCPRPTRNQSQVPMPGIGDLAQKMMMLLQDQACDVIPRYLTVPIDSAVAADTFKNRGISGDVICFLEAWEPWVAKWKQADFDLFKESFANVGNLVWVTRGAWGRDRKDGDVDVGKLGGEKEAELYRPEAALFWGLARTILSENWEEVNPIVIDLDPVVDNAHLGVFAESIMDIFREAIIQPPSFFPEVQEREFLLTFKGGEGNVAVEIPRLMPLDGLNERILGSDHLDTVDLGTNTAPVKRSEDPIQALWDIVALKGKKGGVVEKCRSQPSIGSDVENVTFPPLETEKVPVTITEKRVNGISIEKKSVDAVESITPKEIQPEFHSVDVFPSSPSTSAETNTPRTARNGLPTVNGGAGEGTMVNGGGRDGAAKLLDPKAVYIVIGGLGGIGRWVCELLVRLGARYILIPTREGGSADTPEAQIWLGGMGTGGWTEEEDGGGESEQYWEATADTEDDGVQGDKDTHWCYDDDSEFKPRITIQTTPIPANGGFYNLLSTANTPFTSLRIGGIVMAATTLSDSLLHNMHFSQWNHVLSSKANLTLALHKALLERGRDRELNGAGTGGEDPVRGTEPDWMILLSSAAGVIGNRGQGNYNAANVVLDAVASQRGRPSAVGSGGKQSTCVSLALGPVLGAGLLARDAELTERLLGNGFIGVELDALEKVIVATITQSQSHDDKRGKLMVPPHTIVGVGTGGLIQQNNPRDPFWARTALFSYLNRVDLPLHLSSTSTSQGITAPTSSSTEQEAATLSAKWTATLSALARKALVATSLVHAVVAQLGNRSAADVQIDGESPASLGVDSLSGMGLREWIRRVWGVNVSVLEITGGMTFGDLSGVVVGRREEREVQDGKGGEEGEEGKGDGEGVY